MVWANFTCSLDRLPSGIVAEQLGEDQQRVERRAQLVGHVGQEVGLVLAGLFQFARLQGDGGAGALQFVALGFQRLGLLFQLAVGLFQLDLLLLQPGLGFLERAALFLQFLVGDPQLLALDLQLLGLALGFLQDVLQFGAIARRAQGDADGAEACSRSSMTDRRRDAGSPVR
jgi:hypothetical protein